MSEAAKVAADTPKPVKLKPVKADIKGEADDTTAEKSPLKQKMLATALSRSIVIAALIASIAYATAGLLGARYSLTPAPNTNNNFVYRIDRLTGAVQFCGQQQCVALSKADK